jgi:hypothetical protein
MSYSVKWESKYNRPTVNGKVQNPETGEIEDVESKTSWSGPPSVDAVWINIHGDSDFKIVRTSFCVTVDEVYLEVANHIRDKVYKIVSISASAYSFHITCLTEKSLDEFRPVLMLMKRKLGRLPEGSVDIGHSPPDQ